MRDYIYGYFGISVEGRRSSKPALLDRLQSISGLILALFIVGHIFFTSSILLGKDAMHAETKLFEGTAFLDNPQPIVVSFAVLIIFSIFILHAALAMRKFPVRYREYRVLYTHAATLSHLETKLWIVQALSGFLMFFLASVHLYLMLTIPDKIGPYASSDRIYSDRMWILYALLMITVIVHAMVGLYRLYLKWGIASDPNPRRSRKVLKMVMITAILLLSVLGYSALATYMRIGYEHRESYGERYLPGNGIVKGDME